MPKLPFPLNLQLFYVLFDLVIRLFISLVFKCCCCCCLSQNITSVTIASRGLKIGDRVLVGGTKVNMNITS